MELSDIALVKDSLEKMAREAERAVPLFYGRLFTLDPELCSLFSADNASSHFYQFLNTLNMAISNIYSPETIIPTIKELGRSHVNGGVLARYYFPFGEALFWTLAEMQGENFSEATAGAWTEFYYLLAGLMKEGADAGSSLAKSSHSHYTTRRS